MSSRLVTRTPAALFAAVALTAFAGGTERAANAAPDDATSAKMSCATSGATYHCKGRIRTDAAATPRAFMPYAATPSGYGPADLASAYGLNPALKPTNAVIAIVDAFGYANAEKDLGVYRAQYGLPPCTIANGCLTIVNQQGKTTPLPPAPPANDDWTVETALDLDMASAACPNCKLLLVQANDDTSNGLLLAQAVAASLGATVISDSWGGPETAASTGQSQESFFTLTKPVTIFVAAGDDGYDDGGQGPDYPSVSAHVVAVGGTSLTKAAGTTRGWTETAWSVTANAAAGAGGSSCSISVPIPTFQTNIATTCKFRATSDVSAVGDPATGLAVYNLGAGGWIVVGGTSASSPFVAGVYALYGLGDKGPSFAYSNQTAWNDVLTGTNGKCGTILCNSAKGWDGPTGFGTPNGTALAALGTTAPLPPPDMAMGPDMASGSNGGGATDNPGSGSGNGTGGGNGNGTGGGNGNGTGGNAAGNGNASMPQSNGGTAGLLGCDFGGGAAGGDGLALVMLLGCALVLRRWANR